jgi:hypothetical protein
MRRNSRLLDRALQLDEVGLDRLEGVVVVLGLGELEEVLEVARLPRRSSAASAPRFRAGASRLPSSCARSALFQTAGSSRARFTSSSFDAFSS